MDTKNLHDARLVDISAILRTASANGNAIEATWTAYWTHWSGEMVKILVNQGVELARAQGTIEALRQTAYGAFMGGVSIIAGPVKSALNGSVEAMMDVTSMLTELDRTRSELFAAVTIKRAAA